MKSLIIVFGALLLIIGTPFVFDALDDTRTTEVEQTFAGVTTGGSEYSANVTLGRAIFNNDATSVTLATSNTTADSPSVASYNSVSRVVTVGGLVESQTRTLLLEYKIDSPDLPAGVSAFLVLVRWFYVFTILGMSAGAIYAFFD